MKNTFLPTLVSASLLAATPAGADVRTAEPGVAAAAASSKDYSKNAATGDYRLLYADRIRTSSLAGTTSPPATGRPASSVADGFSWGDAGIGAGAGFVLALAGAAFVLAVRRLAHS